MPTATSELTLCWSQQEFEMLDLGDKRLTQRLITVASALSTSPQSAIHAACEDWSATKAAYRLFDNEQVTAGKILGIDPSDISRLKHGDFNRFSIERLFTLLNRFNRNIEIRITPAEDREGHQRVVAI